MSSTGSIMSSNDSFMSSLSPPFKSMPMVMSEFSTASSIFFACSLMTRNARASLDARLKAYLKRKRLRSPFPDLDEATALTSDVRILLAFSDSASPFGDFACPLVLFQRKMISMRVGLV